MQQLCKEAGLRNLPKCVLSAAHLPRLCQRHDPCSAVGQHPKVVGPAGAQRLLGADHAPRHADAHTRASPDQVARLVLLRGAPRDLRPDRRSWHGSTRKRLATTWLRHCRPQRVVQGASTNPTASSMLQAPGDQHRGMWPDLGRAGSCTRQQGMHSYLCKLVRPFHVHQLLLQVARPAYGVLKITAGRYARATVQQPVKTNNAWTACQDTAGLLFLPLHYGHQTVGSAGVCG